MYPLRFDYLTASINKVYDFCFEIKSCKIYDPLTKYKVAGFQSFLFHGIRNIFQRLEIVTNRRGHDCNVGYVVLINVIH